jgi:predicted Zn-dependent peptidase
VARAKAQLRSGLLMGLERPSARAEQIAAHLLAYGRVIPIEEIKQKLDAVSVGAVRGVGERLMATRQPAIAALGPIDSLESYESFAGRFSPAAHAAE